MKYTVPRFQFKATCTEVTGMSQRCFTDYALSKQKHRVGLALILVKSTSTIDLWHRASKTQVFCYLKAKQRPWECMFQNADVHCSKTSSECLPFSLIQAMASLSTGHQQKPPGSQERKQWADAWVSTLELKAFYTIFFPFCEHFITRPGRLM